MDVSVIMINYNTFDLTVKAVESLYEFTKDLSFEIILIDNASPDGSGEKLKEYFGDKIRYIRAEENLGTSKAFNRCLNSVTGKYVFWLNTDVLFTENFIKKLYDYMEEHPDCGIAGGNLLDGEGNPCHSYLQKITSIKTIKRNVSVINLIKIKALKMRAKYEYNYTDKAKEVGYITGADMMIRKSVIDKVGGFDEDIFMYAEEVEFTFRAIRDTGIKVVSVPWAKLIHYGGKSVSDSKFSMKREELFHTGNLVYFKKCYGIKTARKYLKVLKKGYSKLAFVAKIMGDKYKVEKNRKKEELVKNMLKDFDRTYGENA